MMDNFLTGLNSSNRYTREPACVASVKNLMDSFFDMEVNRTAPVPTDGDDRVEGEMLFIAKVISESYRDTIYNCFAMSLQIYAKAKVDYESFPNDEERFISFLFNMLEHSFEIRKHTEDLITYGETSDYINYAKALGSLTQDLIFFTYDSAAAPLG